MRHRLVEIYEQLLEQYGKQGWWPVASMAGKSGFDRRGYHRDDYSHPRTEGQRWEVIAGAILTQNTSWKNVEKAMANLQAHGLADRKSIAACRKGRLAVLIRPAGYYNQKAERLKIAARFFSDNPDILSAQAPEMRERLLGVKGIGPETADSIMLFAAKRPIFVIDAYTRRIISRIGLARKDTPYEGLQRLFMEALPPDEERFNEYHALLVEHAKRHCRAKPICGGCPLAKICGKRL